MFNVVKPFAFSLDGFTSVSFVEGDGREDFGTHTAGLEAEGYIVAAEPKSEVTVTVADPDGSGEAVEMAVATEAPIEAKPARRTRK